jgi:hypothetical protein
MATHWSDGEKEELTELYETHGRDFKAISTALNDKFGNGRSPKAVLNQLTYGAGIVEVGEKVGFEGKIRRLTDQLADLEKRYKEALRYRELEDAIIEACNSWGAKFDPVPTPELIIPESDVVRESSVSLLGDWHLWEVVDAADTGGLGEYNMEIASAYMQMLAETTIDITKRKLRGYRFGTHYVLMLGDMVSSNIHGIMEHSPGTAIDSLLEGQVLVARYLMDLCQHWENVHVVGVVGNHGRLSQQKRYKKRYCNWDFALYNNVAMMLANQPNITFDFPRSFWHIVEIEGKKFLILHGDDIRSWNQIPWYGIDRAVRKFREILEAYGQNFDYVAMGHFHNTGVLQSCNGEKLINGAAIGTTDFSLGRLFTGNMPQQSIYGVHPDHGATWRYHLRLRMPEQRRYAINRSRQIHEQWRWVLHGGVGDIDPNFSEAYTEREAVMAG